MVIFLFSSMILGVVLLYVAGKAEAKLVRILLRIVGFALILGPSIYFYFT